MVEPLKLVDARIDDALSSFCSELKQQAARALQLCGITTSQVLCGVPAKTVLEMTAWMTGHVPLVKAMPVIGVDLDTLAKTVLVLKCRLRLGIKMADVPLSPRHKPLPTLSVATRVRREVRPKTPLGGASRPGKRVLSRTSKGALSRNRVRPRALREGRIPSVKRNSVKSRAKRLPPLQGPK